MQYFLSIEIQEVFLLGASLSFIICFGIYYRVWVKSNKLIYLILLISGIMIGGNTLPAWWNYGAENYDFIYNMGFSIISAFIFYWLTIGLEEIKKKEFYSFYSLDFLLSCYNLFSHFYLKENLDKKIKEVEDRFNARETSIKVIKLKIDIPYYKFFEIRKDRDTFIKIILTEYELEFGKIEEQKKKMEEESLEIIEEVYKGKFSEEIIQQSEKNIREMYSKKNNYIYKIYNKIFLKRKEFEDGLNYYSNLGDFKEVDKTREFLNFTKEMLNGELDQVEWFLKNFENIESYIFPLIKNNIERLKFRKKFIPPITLILDTVNFGILDYYMIYELIILLYKDEEKFYFNYKTKIKEKIIGLKKMEDNYYLELKDRELNFKELDLREIAIDKNGVIIM